MKLSNFLHDLTIATKLFDLDYNCFSEGQLKSKEWLVEVLNDVRRSNNINLGIIYILCGWYGILSTMLFLKFNMIHIRSFDIDKKHQDIADQINKTHVSDGWKFKAITQDIFDINFEQHSWQCWSNKYNRMSKLITEIPNTIINTSCEHTNPEWFSKVPKGKFIILQSNDSITEEGHINPINDLDEFINMFPLQHVYYKGQLKFQKYTRFMIIGEK